MKLAIHQRIKFQNFTNNYDWNSFKIQTDYMGNDFDVNVD